MESDFGGKNLGMCGEFTMSWKGVLELVAPNPYTVDVSELVSISSLSEVSSFRFKYIAMAKA